MKIRCPKHEWTQADNITVVSGDHDGGPDEIMDAFNRLERQDARCTSAMADVRAMWGNDLDQKIECVFRSQEFGRGPVDEVRTATVGEALEFVQGQWMGPDYVDGNSSWHSDYCTFTMEGLKLTDLGRWSVNEWDEREFTLGFTDPMVKVQRDYELDPWMDNTSCNMQSAYCLSQEIPLLPIVDLDALEIRRRAEALIPF